jgi:hypothetical protein
LTGPPLDGIPKIVPNHSNIHDLAESYQRQMLPVILAAAQAAKDECKRFQDITRRMLASQKFFASTPGSVSAYAIQVEQTLQKYMDGKPIKRSCWGCGGDHAYMVKGKIVCPCGKAWLGIPIFDSNSWYPHQKRNPNSVSDSGNSSFY